jgi:hypothetical protein
MPMMIDTDKQFTTFIYSLPSGGVTRNDIVLLCLSLSGLGIVMTQFQPDVLPALFNGLIVVGFLAATLLTFNKFWRQKRKKNLEGEVSLSIKGVLLNEKLYTFSTISNFILKYDDVAGKVKSRHSWDASGMYSDGCDNFFKMETKAGEIIEHNFEVKSVHHQEMLQPFIIEAKRLGVLKND